MAEFIQFVAKRGVEAAKNVCDFVRHCREEITIFGADLDFDANRWLVGEYIETKGKGGAQLTILFSDYHTSKQAKGLWTFMKEPFLSFAKAYVRYMHGLRPIKSLGCRLAALRSLEYALSESGAAPALERADTQTFTRAADLMKKKHGKSAYGVGLELQVIADICTQNHLTLGPIQWRSHIKRPGDINRIGKEADKRRTNLLPSQAALEALPKVFWLASTTEDCVIASAAALMASSPDRANELLVLPAYCGVVREYKGKEVYGLRWWPAKGAEPMVKWIVPSMVDVAKESVQRLQDKTNQARTIAKWYEEHPTQVYLSGDLEYLRQRQMISIGDVASILGIITADKWLKSNRIQRHDGGYRFSDVEAAVVRMLPRHFPLLVRETGLKYSDALFIVQKNSMHSQRGTYRCMIEPVTIRMLNDGLGASVGYGIQSIFSRFGFTEPDGSAIKMKTNQFRHWLNTLAQRGGMSQLDIAKWSGRKDIRQNRAYDHMTAGELVEKLREVAGEDVNVAGLPLEVRESPPLARAEFLKMMIPAAHTTELGFCVHDWTFLPCQLHRDCIQCPEHCYLKGDRDRMVRIRQALAEAEQQLRFAEDALAEGDFGADRWTEHQLATVARLRNLVELYDDPNLPDETLIRLSTPEVPSRIRFAMAERGQLELRTAVSLTRRV